MKTCSIKGASQFIENKFFIIQLTTSLKGNEGGITKVVLIFNLFQMKNLDYSTN